MRRWLVPVCGALLAASCSGGEPDTEPSPSPTPPQGPRTLVADDLDLDTLGPRIVGPEGPTMESEIPGLGTMVSYVACPKSIEGDECLPDELPEESAVYTYVHTVTLTEPGPEQARDQWAGVTMFRTDRPVSGFAFVLGYEEEEAIAALGEDYAIKTQVDNGALIWRITAGDGWMPGETITFYWRSTNPPEGPAAAYVLEADGLDGLGTGPFPAEEDEESGDSATAP